MRLVACFFLTIALPCLAITPEDVLSIRELSDLRLAPDGTRVAFVVAESPDRKTSIWIAGTDGKAKPQRVAAAGDSPRWSPDGQTLAFLDESSHIRLLCGGHITQLTSARVEDFQWSPNGREIAYVVRDPKLESDPITVDGPVSFTRLWIAKISDGTMKQLTRDDFEISEIAWSPDGRELALVVAPSSKPEDGDRARLVVIDRAGGNVARTVSPHVAFAGALRWSPDGRLLTFYDRVTSDPFATWISVVPAAGGAVRPILKDYRGTVYRIEWQSDSAHLLGEAGIGTRHALISIDAVSGTVAELAQIISSQWDVGFSTNGRAIAYLAQTPTSPSDIWTMDLEAHATRKLTDFNPQTRSWRLGAVSEVTWENSKDGLLRRGVLITPPNYDAARRYPTVVIAHPGDTAFWTG